MRFLFTAPRFHTNQHYAVQALLHAGHEVSFLALRRGQSEEYSALEPVVLGYSWLSRLLARFLAKWDRDEWAIRWGFPPPLALYRRVRRFRPDAMVVRNPNSAYGMLALLVAKAVGARVIFYTQGPKHRRLGTKGRLFRQLPMRLFGAQWITPVLGNQHTPPLPNVHYVPFVTPALTPPERKTWFGEDAVNLLEIGKFQPRKGHVVFLDAVHRLAKSYPVKATIVGECSTPEHHRELERVRGHIQALGLNKSVAVKLNLPFSEVQKEYAAHDLFVLASSDEPAAVSPLEAMAHSLPVVCSDSNGTSCYVRPGENGAVFRSGDVDDLAVQLEAIVRDRQGLKSMGACSHRLVLDEHAPQRYVDALCALVKGEAPPR